MQAYKLANYASVLINELLLLIILHTFTAKIYTYIWIPTAASLGHRVNFRCKTLVFNQFKIHFIHHTLP